MNDLIPTNLLISAQTRIAAQNGVSMIVLNKGDPSNGAIFLKINRLDGTFEVLSQIRLDEELVWSALGKGEPMTEEQADSYLAKQADFDPDLWIVEIEDREGRPWFPGKVIGRKIP